MISFTHFVRHQVRFLPKAYNGATQSFGSQLRCRFSTDRPCLTGAAEDLSVLLFLSPVLRILVLTRAESPPREKLYADCQQSMIALQMDNKDHVRHIKARQKDITVEQNSQLDLKRFPSTHIQIDNASAPLENRKLR